MLVKHAERWVSDKCSFFFKTSYSLFLYRVTPLVLERFLVRLYRENNKTGFVKTFSDQPEHITSGLSPLKNLMRELQLRTVHVYPRYYPPVRVLRHYYLYRFHEEIKTPLERCRAESDRTDGRYSPRHKSIHECHSIWTQAFKYYCKKFICLEVYPHPWTFQLACPRRLQSRKCILPAIWNHRSSPTRLRVA